VRTVGRGYAPGLGLPQSTLCCRFIQRRNGTLNGVLSSAQPRDRREELTSDRVSVGCNDAPDVSPKRGRLVLSPSNA
jgi:hypothetical protein